LDFLQTAEEAARIGGHVLRSWASRFTVQEKSRANLVTEADHASQAAIHEFISRRYPQHDFLGEEDLSTVLPNARYRWIIDPLDGTTNYVHGFPYYAVSIGLEQDGELITGAVYNPVSEEMFLASVGGGAWLNRRRLQCSAIETLDQSMVIASLPVVNGPNDPAVQRFLKVLGSVQTVQRTGSAALNLAFLAAGRIDAFWSTSLKPWDMAAGVLLVREAGGLVTGIEQGPFNVNVPNMLSSNGSGIHAELSRLLV